MRGGVVEMDVGVTLQPIIPLGFVSVKIVQHYVDLFLRTASYHFVHEIQKLSPSAAGIVASLHQSRCHLQGGK